MDSHGGSAIVEHDAGGLAALAHVHAGAAGVVEQDGVKLGTPHLVGVGVAGVGLAEVPAPGLAIGAPDHGRAALDGEAGALDLIHHAQIVQDGDAGRQQGLADVGPREAFALQQDDSVPLACEEGAGAGTGGPAADDDDGWLSHSEKQGPAAMRPGSSWCCGRRLHCGPTRHRK